MVIRAGGTPLILPCSLERASDYVGICDGIILSGGDDPSMEQWGVATHPKAKSIDPIRQEFELAMLEALRLDPDKPVLGICLGMQLMALDAGGALDQYLFDSLSTAADHWDHQMHSVSGVLGSARVFSHHRQAITDPGALQIVARAHDGLIEAVRDAGRRMYLGVQWHPERTDDDELGFGLVRALIGAAIKTRMC